VGRHSSKNHKDCALFDKSTKFGTQLEKSIINKSGYRGIANLTSDGCGGHFPKWLPMVAVRPVMLNFCWLCTGRTMTDLHQNWHVSAVSAKDVPFGVSMMTNHV